MPQFIFGLRYFFFDFGANFFTYAAVPAFAIRSLPHAATSGFHSGLNFFSSTINFLLRKKSKLEIKYYKSYNLIHLLKTEVFMSENEFRKSGILLHITSLPGSQGIGTLGSEAYKFCDWLSDANQSLWQVLPLGPTGYGDSPYASFSTFAGNPLLIDLDLLVQKNWACEKDLKIPDFIKKSGNVDFGSLVYWKIPLLYKCAEYFLQNSSSQDRAKFNLFKNENKDWLDDFALFTSIKKFFDKKAESSNVSGEQTRWNNFWSKNLARHEKTALEKWTLENNDELEQIKAVQFFFFEQWADLKKYASSKNIKIIGDIPIFVAADSADLWANKDIFQINKRTLQLKAVAGVPPDYFSATGQLWGNPLYDWNQLKKTSFDWWIKRISHILKLVDIVRIDHFRGFESYWKIPAEEKTAVNGTWTRGPGIALFDEIKCRIKNSSIIAEDLGVITKKVAELRDKAGFPGMKILQFAFDSNDWNEESEKNPYLPKNYKNENCVVYTGTHDNDTSFGLLSSSSEKFRANVKKYFKLDSSASNQQILDAMIRGAFMSKAKFCIIPLQDVYALGSECRMNTPSTSGTNWSWRMEKNLLDEQGTLKLKKLSKESGRNLC